MSSAAASAAFAAFKGGSQPSNGKTPVQRKPNFHIKLDTNGSRIANESRAGTPLSAKAKQAPTATAPLESPVFNIKGSKDDQAFLPSEHEYFYASNNHSYSSHDVAEAASRSKISVNTRPEDMLKLVRASINSKSKVGINKDSTLKGQMAINDFRNSLEQRRQLGKRNISPNPGSHNPLINVTKEDLVKSTYGTTSASASNENIPERPDIPFRYGENGSQSSIGSYESENRDQLLIPPVKMSVTDFDSDDESLRKKGLHSVTASPIQIPPSPNALARGLAAGGDSVPYLSILPGYMSSNPDVHEQYELKGKLGRKPPPDLVEYANKSRKESWSASDVSLSSDQEDSGKKSGIVLEGQLKKLSVGSEDSLSRSFIERQARDSTQKNYPLISKGTVLQNTDQDTDDYDQFPNMPVATGQPVKLKTTLRKMSKKKEKRTIFNEDKPWKNHSDLDMISDQQRKRYEGLWVSNKGLYVNRTVSRLVGVNYAKEERKSNENSDRRELSEKEISEWAAKLSLKVKYNVDTDESDIGELHGLENATMEDLMHGIVVKRIWKRSKLLNEVLGAIWDLVDFRKDGTLNKAEFLVGMWLVDQCLYGRKLPKTVPKSVWNSVGNFGLNVVLKKKRR